MYSNLPPLPPRPDGVNDEQWEQYKQQWNDYHFAQQAQLVNQMQQQMLLYNRVAPAPAAKPLFNFKMDGWWFFILTLLTFITILFFQYDPFVQMWNATSEKFGVVSNTLNIVQDYIDPSVNDADKLTTWQKVNDWVVTSDFDDMRGDKKHRAIDIALSKGNENISIGMPVYAPYDANVEGFTQTGKCGYGARLEFPSIPGYLIVLCHLNKSVTTGTYKQGEVFAEVGNTGGSTGPHLHIELSKVVNDEEVYLNVSKDMVRRLVYGNGLEVKS